MFGLSDSPIDKAKLIASLQRHEGSIAYVYDDHNGQPIVRGYTVIGTPTLGIGRNVTKDRGLSPAEQLYLAGNDVDDCLAEAEQQSWYGVVCPCEPRLRSVVEILFNLGLPDFNNFRNAIAALNAGDWATASAQFLDSDWAREIGQRANELAGMIETGTDPA